MTASDLPPSLAATPEWLAFDLDGADMLTLLRLDEQAYRRASFLDQRILGPAVEASRVPWPAVAAALSPDARRDARFIFHIGNVGSTLIARMLGELPGMFALREPLILRTFAERLGQWPGDEGERRLDTLRALLSRTFRHDQRAIVKATSFASEIAARLVPPGSAALMLFAHPQAYVENILAGDNSRQTAAMLAPMRAARLARRCPGLELDPAGLGSARLAALGWLCEMSSLEANAAQLPQGSVLWLDFDRFLAAPAAHFAAVAAHFGQPVDGAAARAVAEGPLLRRYSKAPEYEYSPQLRRDLLAQARRQHGAAIHDALGWLNGLAGRYPAAAWAIRRALKGS